MFFNLSTPKIITVFASSCLSPAVLSKAQADEEKPEASQNPKSAFVTVKPSALFLATGAGLELGSHLSPTSAVGVSAELDHYLVGGSFFAGVFGRQYLARSPFVQLGVGYQEIFFHDFLDRGVGGHAVFGSEWQLRKVTLGADWFGVHYSAFTFQERSLQNWNPSFPKLRIGWALL